VSSRQDYGNNATLAVIAAYGYLICRLQSALNVAVRAIDGLPHFSTTFVIIHGLHARIKFKLATLIFRNLQGVAPR